MAKNINQLPIYGLDKLSRAQKNTVKDFLFICTEKNYPYSHTGSRLVKDIEWDDVDFLVKVPNLEDFRQEIIKAHWEEGGSRNAEERMISFKKSNINIIATDNQEFYDNWVEASNIVSGYQTKHKQNRVTIFNYVVDKIGTAENFKDALDDKEPKYATSPFFSTAFKGPTSGSKVWLSLGT